MSKSLELKKVIKSLLDESEGKTYYRNAPDDAAFPYKTFKLNSVQLGDSAGRDDGVVLVDVWDYGKNANKAELIADQIEKIFDHRHISNDFIMSSFYSYIRNSLDDNDKKIQHIQLQIQYKSYYIGE